MPKYQFQTSIQSTDNEKRKNKMKQFKDIEVGEAVYSTVWGRAIVIEKGVTRIYVRASRAGDGDCTSAAILQLNYEGVLDRAPYPLFYTEEQFKTLYPQDYAKIAYAHVKVDTPIWVSHSGNAWIPAHFSSWNSDGTVRVWHKGRTSHTSFVQESYILFSLTNPDENENEEE